jgi:TNF receptor-associated protein 1
LSPFRSSSRAKGQHGAGHLDPVGKSEITEEEYTEFYKFIANAVDEPLYRLHFSADAPLAINALLFVPKENFEIMGSAGCSPGSISTARKC